MTLGGSNFNEIDLSPLEESTKCKDSHREKISLHWEYNLPFQVWSTPNGDVISSGDVIK